MIRPPIFETAIVVGDNAALMAEVSSFFRRPGRYLSVLEGPRMSRPDSSNEVTRCHNAVSRAQPLRILFADLPEAASSELEKGFPPGITSSISNAQEAARSLRGVIRPSVRELRWPQSNLGIGTLLAKQSNSTLIIDQHVGLREQTFVSNGRHALLVCETTEAISQIIAANLAFSIGASFLVIPEVPKEKRREWLDHLYSLGSAEQVRNFGEIAAQVREYLPPEVTAGRYSEIIFVTSEFPWGISLPECPTSHLFSYPALGPFVVNGIWASNYPAYTARNALLIDPGEVEAEEVDVINKALTKNRTLNRVVRGPGANVHRVDMMVQAIPFDFISISTHAGYVGGERNTYQFPDREGRIRRLVVDEAAGIGYDPEKELYSVTSHCSFRSLDGVRWDDEKGKEELDVGSAIRAWSEDITSKRTDFLVSREPIDRVHGAMAMRMSDHVWMVGGRGTPAAAMPIILNNACSSFHRLAAYFVFGGARAYLGTMFQIADVEAIEVTKVLFGKEMGMPLSVAVWRAQQSVYGTEETRRPYVLVGLPFSRIPKNTTNSPRYLRKELNEARRAYDEKSQNHPREDVRKNSADIRDYLANELEVFNSQFPDS